MKIAFILGSFPILSETFILSQITGLLDRGIHVDIFARGVGEDKVIHPDVYKYDLLSRTNYFGSNYQNITQSRPLRIFRIPYFIARYISNNPLPLIRSLNFLKYGKQAGNLSLFYTVEKLKNSHLDSYDIIHCHFGDIGRNSIIFRELGLIKGKFITSFYGWDCSSYTKKYGRDVYHELFKKTDLILCLSEEMRLRLVELGCPAEKIQIHHLGIDVDRFMPDLPGYKGNGSIKLLTVGRMVEKKGIEYAIRAVSQLVQKYPDIHYTLIGDGPLRKVLERLTDELGISDNVHFLGPKNQTDIIDAMKRSDIFLAPSVTARDGDMEGTPTVLMEAHAMKMLVLSTFHSGIPEVVLDGRSGYLVPERNSKEIAKKIEYLIERPDKWNEMLEHGRSHIEKEFNTAILSEKLEGMYRYLIQN